MRKCLIFVTLGCLLFLGGCAGASGGGGGSGNLNGTVIDLNSTPVSYADVVVDSTSTKTLSNGTYSFTNIPAGTKIIRITSTARTPSYKRVSLAGGTTANAGISILANLDSKVTPIARSTGGTATNTTGSIKMVFPADSVTADPTNIVLTTVPKIAAPFNPPEEEQFVSYILYAKPETMTLDTAARLSLPNLTQVPSTVEVSFYKFNTSTLAWELLPGKGHPTAETNTIDFDTDQMGWIAAIMPIYPTPGWIAGAVTSLGSPVSGVNVWTTSSFDITDASGSYRLNYIPAGTAEVYASALGYQLYTSPVQTISSDTQTTLNIDLSSYIITQGNISGVVRELNGSALYQARVIESNGGETFTDLYGRYALYNVPAGYTNVTAYSSEHISSTESNVLVPSAGTVSDINFNLPYIGQASTYEFTFETATAEGFTTEADSYGHDFWHVQQFYLPLDSPLNPQNYFNSAHGDKTRKVYLKDDGVVSVNGRIPKPHGDSYYFWYGQTDPATSEASYIGIEDTVTSTATYEGSGGTTANNQSTSGTLESPAMDLRGYTFGKLSFWTWWEIEGKNPKQGPGYDAMYILISSGPPYTSWDLIGYLNPYEDPAKTINVSGEAYTSGGFNQPGLWVQHSYDISQYAGSSIKVRFVFDTHDKLYNGFRGWFLDDIKVENLQFGLSSFGGGIRSYPSFPKEPRN